MSERHTTVKPGPYDFWPAGIEVTVVKIESGIGNDYDVYVDGERIGAVESTKVHPGSGTTLNLHSKVTRWATDEGPRTHSGFIYVTRKDAIGAMLVGR